MNIPKKSKLSQNFYKVVPPSYKLVSKLAVVAMTARFNLTNPGGLNLCLVVNSPYAMVKNNCSRVISLRINRIQGGPSYYPINISIIS